MPTFRRSLALRPIHSQKRESTWSNLGENASTVKNVILLSCVDSPTSGIQCSVGSHVKWIYIETNLNGVDNSGVVQVFHWMIYKNPSNQFAVQDPTSYDTSVKKWVLKRGMEMLPEIPIGSGGTVQTKRIFVIRIPKGMQRMADTDRIILSYKSTSTSGINYCGISIFKYLE